MFEVGGIIMREYFAIIEDPRHKSYVRHNLDDILIMVMCSVLCGITDLSGIVSFSQNKAEFFKRNFKAMLNCFIDRL